MLSLAALQQQLQQSSLPPVETWDPPFCGDIPLQIDSNGDWLYQHSKIQRLALIKLFASVLLRQDDAYYLQTPVEKVRIEVTDAPLIVTQHNWLETDNGRALCLTLNTEQEIVVSPQYPLQLQRDPQQQFLPYLQLWRGLTAKLHRNVYYQLAEHVSAVYCNGQLHYQIKSAGFPYTFAIGSGDAGR